MSSFPNVEGLHPHTHDSQSFPMHSSRDYGRRAPRVHSGERYERHGHSNNPIAESSRARHWKTVMGKETTFDKPASGSSSASPGNTQQGRHYAESTRQEHLRVSRPSAVPNDPLVTQYPGRQYDSTWRHSRPTPPKPFVCDQCPRRFERRGHLEVCNLEVFYILYMFSFSVQSSILSTQGDFQLSLCLPAVKG